jgi:4-amino-4-deoxy-L-arabinose transferase-like glycosyltransferase
LQLKPDVSRRTALLTLTAITAAGALFRFYNLGWGAPYYHFHQDEHYVLSSADMLRRDPHVAAMSAKYFMYTPLLPYFINMARAVCEWFSHPLNLAVPADEVTYMVLARGISAAFGTATIPVVYGIATRLAGRIAGLFAAFFLAFAVLHLRDSHFAATDIIMVFFCALTLWASLHLVERGDWSSLVLAGVAFGFSILAKYTGAFVLGVVGVAYFLAPGRPGARHGISVWVRWAARGIVPIVVGFGIFLTLFPLVWQYPDKFRADIKEWVTDPLSGVTKPIWIGQFADLKVPELYWFTNLLWWGVGPMLEIVGLAGIVWLLVKWDRRAGVVASFPIIYFVVAGRTIAPMIRYSLPLVPALAIAAGALGAEWSRQPRWRTLAFTVMGATVLTTGLYAIAYMNVFRQPDSRLQASKWLIGNVPENTKILVEPSQNTPPVGGYLTATNFNNDYVLWGGTDRRSAERERHDYYHLYTFDAYRYLYADRYEDAEKRRYINSRLEKADWIVMDDTYKIWYEHLQGPENAVLKQHYQDLLSGKLGFTIVKTFKTYPRLFGIDINDDSAEMTFKLFDHPRVYVLQRYSQSPAQ